MKNLNLSDPETLFRKHMCKQCDYRERSKVNNQDTLICGLPCTKECILEHFELMSDRAEKYVRALKKRNMEDLEDE